MKICFFTRYEIDQGSSRERIGVYLESLCERGHRYQVISIIPNKLRQIGMGKIYFPTMLRKIYTFWYNGVLRYCKCFGLIMVAKEFDLIVVQKVNFPGALIMWLRARNENIIFDFDDLFFWPNSPSRTGIRPMFGLRYRGPKVLKLFKHIIAGNSYLAEMAYGVGQPQVTIIPTSVNCDLYYPAMKDDNHPLIIGFCGSGENHLEYLKLLVRPLDVVGRVYPFIFKLIGTMNSKKIKSLFCSSAYRFVSIDWLTAAQELSREIRSFDIGVMPLTDSDEARAKCGFKALLYMASGVATLASPIGVNRDIIKDGANGLWARSEDEWIEKLLLLIRNKDLRDNLALEGRKTVLNHYSLKKISRLFVDTLENVLISKN